MALRSPTVELAGVELRYRGREPVLCGVDLRVGPGDTVVVTGANGSGKSSLLKVVAGVVPATAGRVLRRPRTVGYVPDRFPAQLRMSASSYLRHLAAVHRADPAVARRAAHELLDALGFTGGLDVPMSELSKGNAQKIALTQALCSTAELLVLDEPFSGLDVDGLAAVGDVVADAASSGAAVLITDHVGGAATLPDARLLSLHDGRLAPTTRAPVPGSTESLPIDVIVTLEASDPQGILPVLPAGRTLAVGPRRVTVQVSLAQRDALLTSALSLGCGIHAVQPGDGAR